MIRKIILGVSLAVLVMYGLTGMAKDISITKDYANFTEISLKCPANLYLKQGDTNYVKIEIDQELLPKVNIGSSDNTFYIDKKYDVDSSFFEGKTFNVYVTVKNIKKLLAHDSAKIVAETDIHSNNIDLNVSTGGKLITKNIKAENINIECKTSGRIKADKMTAANKVKLHSSLSGHVKINSINAKDLNVKATYSCNVKIGAGKVNKQNAYASYSGRYNAKNLISETGKAEAHYSGRLTMNVRGEISVDLSYSGQLHLYGKPAMKHLSVSTSGQFHTEK